MILGSIAVFLIDRRFIHAAAACVVGGVLTLVGLIHAEEVHVFSNPKIALGYGLAAVVCLGYAAMRLPPREIDLSDPIDVEVAAERARSASSARRSGWLSPPDDSGASPR